MRYYLLIELPNAPDGVSDMDREYDDYQDACDAVNQWADAFEESRDVYYTLRHENREVLASNRWRYVPTRLIPPD